METKTCGICRQIVALDSFHKNNKKKDGRTNNCKKCQAAYIREHYERNKEYYIDKAVRQRLALAELLKELKDNKACMDCGRVCQHFALDYDHIDSDGKLNDVSKLIAYGNKKRLLREIAKCELVCATCHRYRTAKRRGLGES